MAIAGMIAPELLQLGISTIGGFFNLQAENEARERANEANELRYSQIIDEQTALGDRVRQQIGQVQSQQLGQLDTDLYNSLEQMSGLRAPLEQGFRDRQSSLMSSLEGLGGQQRRDINRGAEALGSQTRGFLADRGLSNTSLAPSLAGGVERERNEAQGRLGESIRRERLGLEERLSGEQLAFQERHGQFELGFGTQQRTAARLERERLGLLPIEADINLTNTLSGFRERRQDVPPPYQAFGLMQQGANSAFQNVATRRNAEAQAAAQDDGFLGEILAGAGGIAAGIGGGALAAGGGGAALAAGKMFIMCIDGEATINTPTGPRPLSEVKVGDMVRNHHGSFKRVTFLDFGEPHLKRANDYIKIVLADENSIVLTRDHKIGGKPAGDFKVGEYPEMFASPSAIVRIESHRAVPSGDIILEDESPYVASGFIINPALSLAEAVE